MLRFLMFENKMLMFAKKFWLGLEWRDEEEGLNPKENKKMRDKKTKPHKEFLS